MCLLLALYLIIGFLTALVNGHLLSKKTGTDASFHADSSMLMLHLFILVFWPACLSLTLRLIIANLISNSK